MHKYLHEILTLLGRDKKRLPGLLLLFLVVSMLDLAGLGLIGPYISILSDPSIGDDIAYKVRNLVELPTDANQRMILMGCILLGIFSVKAVAAIWINYIIIRFGLDQEIRLRKLLMRAYQSLDYNTFLNRNSAEYIFSTQTLVGRYAGTVVVNGMKLCSDGIVAMSILCFLAWANIFAFSLLVFLIGILIFGYDRIFRKNIKYFGQQANIAAENMVQGIHEGIEGLKEIRILGAEEYFYKQVSKGAEDNGTFHARSQLVSTAPRYLLELILIVFVVILVFSTFLVEQGLQSLIPTLAMFGVASIRLLPAANILSKSLMELRFSRDSVSRLYKDVINAQKIKTDKRNIITKKEEFESLSISNISFRYPNTKKDTLNNLSLDILSGDSIGFIGHSGSGKTTLVDVFLGLLKIKNGIIRFNGKPLNESLDSWRSHVAYLPQEIFLIDSTLKKNIALGVDDDEIDDKRIMRSINQASLTELVDEMQDGVETFLGERGVRLSGGQRQRVALARAFYHERDVLIMDESTSALDNETESEIVKAIQLLKGKKTIIVIAHRLTTIQYCDRIYKLENGRIVESGTPQEILGMTNEQIIHQDTLN
jgi:ATP-binding cassette, subfamily B, bacterial PglK